MKTHKILVGVAILGVIFSNPVGAQTGRTPERGEPSAEDDNASLLLRDADIKDVLRLLAEEYDLNIVLSDDVTGTVTLRLKEVSLINTLDSILLSRGYDYDIRDNIIRVATAEVIAAERGQRLAKQELERLVPQIITLHYLDANDIKSIVKDLLTPRGSVKVLEQRAHKGFQFGTGGGSQTVTSSSSTSSGNSVSTPGDMGGLVRARAGNEEEKPRSHILLVVDVLSQIEKIREVIRAVDIPPKQVLIDTMILEVDTDSLEDLGADLNQEVSFSASDNRSNDLSLDLNSGSSSTNINANIFTNTFPTSTEAGLHTVFNKLTGEDFNLILHALLQDERTKTLSAPKILTVENQEAAILVGEQYPIYEANVTDQGTTTESLSFYQPIGISLQVIAQVTPSQDVIMIIHPTVSSVGALVVGTSGLQQPRINIREADTRVLIRNGETLVIGGLINDVVDERVFRIPLLGRIPWIGNLFTRRQVDLDQRNLLIFITPKIIDQDQEYLNEQEQLTLNGIQDPATYGFLEERRAAVRRIYREAKNSLKRERYDIAREQFLRVLTLDPHHQGAIKHLEELSSLPKGKPIA